METIHGSFAFFISQVDDTLSLTRGDLLVRLQRYAAGFQANGIVPGDRVCVHMGNSVENFVAFFGCIFSGATVVLAKTSLTERERYLSFFLSSMVTVSLYNFRGGSYRSCYVEPSLGKVRGIRNKNTI